MLKTFVTTVVLASVATAVIPAELSAQNPAFISTGIKDIRSFLERCPTNDPAYAQIRQDFDIRIDGQSIPANVACTEPISLLPIDQLTDVVIALQVLRTAYYMGVGTEGVLPWTQKGLYEWMAGNVAGVNIKSAPGQLYCCDLINGKRYFSTSAQDATQRAFKRVWPTGIAISLAFFAHEIHHADAGDPGHTTGCPLFPLPTDAPGCDATYDLSNLGAYGVQYWLNSKWATGYLNIGIGCLPPALAMSYANSNASDANAFLGRFVKNPPPAVSLSQPYGGPCIPSKTTRDFDGDAKQDVLWRNSVGSVAMWRMDGTTIVNQGVIATPSLGWKIVGSGDFNGDGKADILWRDTAGSVSIWLMNGMSIISYAYTASVPLVWEIAAVGDFDGDGKADVLWHDNSGNVAVWLMAGNSIVDQRVIANVTGWTIVGTGDFNSDGKADILWRDTNGNVSIWLMDGFAVTTHSNTGTMPTTSAILAIADFNANGKADILWRDAAGNVFLWLMNGTALVGNSFVANVSPQWMVMGSGDFNGDAKADILWGDKLGDVAIWLMNRNAVSEARYMGNVSDWRPQ